MAVGAVAHRPTGDAAKADLEQLEPLARLVGARIEQVGAGGETGGVEEFRRLLPQQTARMSNRRPSAWVRPESAAGNLGLSSEPSGMRTSISG